MQISQQLKNKKYKLFLIIGRPGSGKSKYLQNYSKETGIPVLNLDQILGKKIPEGKDSNYIYGFARGFLDAYAKDEILIDKKTILYHENSDVDLLDFLKEISLTKTVVATFNGYTEGDKLIHVCDKLEKDYEYDLKTLDIMYIVLK